MKVRLLMLDSFCECGHPIMQNMIVRNKVNMHSMVVGNCCIKKFGIEREHYNKSIKNYLEYALGKAKSSREKEFILELMKKAAKYKSPKMTENQKVWLEKISGKTYRFKYQWDDEYTSRLKHRRW